MYNKIKEYLGSIMFVVIFVFVTILIIKYEHNVTQLETIKEQIKYNDTIDSVNYYHKCIYIDSIGWIDEDDYNQMCWDSINK